MLNPAADGDPDGPMGPDPPESAMHAAPSDPSAPARRGPAGDPPEPTLGDLDPDDRPRERLLRDGAHTLDSASLLALVLGTGRGGGEDALQLARRVLRDAGGLDALGAATPEALQSIRGIGPVKAARIRAAFELALRAGPVEPPDEPPPEPTEDQIIEMLRGQIATGERAVLGFRPGADEAPVTLALGEGLGRHTRIGAHLARLLAEGTGPWWVLVVRPGRGPREDERVGARRLDEGARLVGLDLDRVLLLAGRQHWPLLEGGR